MFEGEYSQCHFAMLVSHFSAPKGNAVWSPSVLCWPVSRCLQFHLYSISTFFSTVSHRLILWGHKYKLWNCRRSFCPWWWQLATAHHPHWNVALRLCGIWRTLSSWFFRTTQRKDQVMVTQCRIFTTSSLGSPVKHLSPFTWAKNFLYGIYSVPLGCLR